MNVKQMQLTVCRNYGAEFFETAAYMKVGIAQNVRENRYPVNGLRLAPEGDTSGWYIWAGEQMSTESDFFMPLHVIHLKQWCEHVLPYLGLPPGWRFLLAPGYVDVWYDAELLKDRQIILTLVPVP